MATTHFKDVSPYTSPARIPPEEDYLYKEFQNDINLDMTKKSNKKPTGMAIFGLGRAGSIHLSNIVQNPRVELLYIVDNITTNFDKIKAYWNLKNITFLTFAESNKIFTDTKVEVVVVTSPTNTHEEIVKKALSSNKAVFCEKPIAHDVESSARCYKLAEAVKKPLFSAFNRRFDPSYSALRDRVRAGEVGHIQVLKIVARDSSIPPVDYLKISGGIFHDCIVHDFDMATWIIGELPIKVQATAVAHIPEIKAIDDFDTVVCVLTYPSGTIAVLENSRNSCYGYDQRLEAFGPKGMIRADNERPIHCNEVQLGYTGSTVAPIWYSFASRYKRAYYLEMEHFLDVVEGKGKLLVEDYQTLAVSKIATAAETSARTSKTVELSWSENEKRKICN